MKGEDGGSRIEDRGSPYPMTPSSIFHPPSSFPLRLHELNADRLAIRIRAGSSRTPIGHDNRPGRIDWAADYRGWDIWGVSDEDKLIRLCSAELERARFGCDRQRNASVITINPR